MAILSLIAAMDEAHGIGRDNQLLCHLPADLQHFKSTTLGKPIIMGRSTFESIGKPLPGRLNIVLSRTMSPVKGVLIFDSLDKALEHIKEAPEVMIIGGAALYHQTINLVTYLYITVIHHAFEADVFFPEIDSQIWHCSSSEFRQKDDKNTFDMTFYRYERKNQG